MVKSLKNFFSSFNNCMFTHRVIKALADSIIQVFVGLIILKETNSVNLFMAYIMSFMIFALLFNLILKKLLHKYCLVFILLHFIPLITSQLVLSLCSIDLITIILISFMLGLSNVMYYGPLNILFAGNDQKTDVAFFQIAVNVGKIVFIIISGLIISKFENSLIFLTITSSLLYIISAIPLLFNLKKVKFEYNPELEKNNSVVQNKCLYNKFNILHIFFGCFQVSINFIFPAWLYVNNLSFESIAIYLAINEFLLILSNYLAKHLFKKGLAVWGSLVAIIILNVSIFLTFFIKNVIAIYIFSCMISIVFPLVFVPTFKLFCQRIQKDNASFDKMIDREICYFSGNNAYWLYYAFPSLITCLGIGMVSSVVIIVMEFMLFKEQTSKDEINDICETSKK